MVHWTRNVHSSSREKMPTATICNHTKKRSSRSGSHDSHRQTENISIKFATNRSNSKALPFFLTFVAVLRCSFVCFTHSTYKVHIFKMSFDFFSMLPFLSANTSVYISFFFKELQSKSSWHFVKWAHKHRCKKVEKSHLRSRYNHACGCELAIEAADSTVDTE